MVEGLAEEWRKAAQGRSNGSPGTAQGQPRVGLAATYGRPRGNIGAAWGPLVAEGAAQGRPYRNSLRSALQGQSLGSPRAALGALQGWATLRLRAPQEQPWRAPRVAPGHPRDSPGGLGAG